MEKNTTIHVFAYGEAQIVSPSINFKASVDSFSKLNSVITEIKSKRPKDVQDKDYHVINIFNNRVDYNSIDKSGNFSLKTSELDLKNLNNLISEFDILRKK